MDFRHLKPARRWTRPRTLQPRPQVMVPWRGRSSWAVNCWKLWRLEWVSYQWKQKMELENIGIPILDYSKRYWAGYFVSFCIQRMLAMGTWGLAQKLRLLFLFVVVVVWFACEKSRSEGRRAKTWALSSCLSCSVLFSFLTNSAAVRKQVAKAKPAGICIVRLSDHVEDARMIILLSLIFPRIYAGSTRLCKDAHREILRFHMFSQHSCHSCGTVNQLWT